MATIKRIVKNYNGSVSAGYKLSVYHDLNTKFNNYNDDFNNKSR